MTGTQYNWNHLHVAIMEFLSIWSFRKFWLLKHIKKINFNFNQICWNFNQWLLLITRLDKIVSSFFLDRAPFTDIWNYYSTSLFFQLNYIEKKATHTHSGIETNKWYFTSLCRTKKKSMREFRMKLNYLIFSVQRKSKINYNQTIRWVGDIFRVKAEQFRYRLTST